MLYGGFLEVLLPLNVTKPLMRMGVKRGQCLYIEVPNTSFILYIIYLFYTYPYRITELQTGLGWKGP